MPEPDWAAWWQEIKRRLDVCKSEHVKLTIKFVAERLCWSQFNRTARSWFRRALDTAARGQRKSLDLCTSKTPKLSIGSTESTIPRPHSAGLIEGALSRTKVFDRNTALGNRSTCAGQQFTRPGTGRVGIKDPCNHGPVS